MASMVVAVADAVDELVGRLAGGDMAARQRLREWFIGSDNLRPDILNAVAKAAAGGVPNCLDLLVTLVDEHGLDRVPIRRVLVNASDVEDAHQDVLMAVARRIGTFRSESAFTTWLHTVARNVAIDMVRRMKDAERLPTDAPELMTDAKRLSSQVATRTDLKEAIDGLPEHYRVVIVLRDVEHKTYAAVAEILGIELGTVQSRLSRARALLAAAIGSDPDIGQG